MNRLAAVIVICALTLPLSAQTKTLVAKSRVASGVTFEGFRSLALPTACDERGALYVKLDAPGQGMTGPIYKLSSKGALEATFDTSGTLMNRYAVRPNGGVAMAGIDDAGRHFVDNFGPDGVRESTVHLDRPPIPLFPDQIAVFHSGEILISGPARRGSNASTAIYDSTGHLIKQFVLDGDADVEREAITRSVATTGDDGLVYLMRTTSPARVYAISASGGVVRKIVVPPPTPTGLPDFAIRVFKNRMAIAFSRNCEKRGARTSCEGTPIYTVVDATTGQRLADYERGDDADGLLACYAPDPDRFRFLSILPAGHTLDIVEAGPK